MVYLLSALGVLITLVAPLVVVRPREERDESSHPDLLPILSSSQKFVSIFHDISLDQIYHGVVV